jgi:hypothetical protein
LSDSFVNRVSRQMVGMMKPAAMNPAAINPAVTSYLFAGAFLVACLGQGFVFFNVGILDEAFWSAQARYVEAGSPEQYNSAHAYGHPGGPVILGTIAVHHLAGISYETALPVFLTLFNSIVIATIATLCYRLRPDSLWWLPVLGTLSIDKLYAVATPTSALVGPLLVLLTLLTLWITLGILEQAAVSWWQLASWSLVAGLAVATRFDIGSITTLFLFGVLATTLRRRQLASWSLVAGLAVAAFAVFVACDPYMWYMPVQHVGDLMGRLILNYRHSTPASIPATLEPMHVVSFSALAFVGMLLSIVGETSVFPSRRTIPRQLVLALVPLTVLLYGIYLSARCPAVRYFIPIVFIWQAFLPLQLFDLIAGLQFESLRTEAARARARQLCAAVVVLLLVGSQIAFLLDHARLEGRQSVVVSR